MSLCPQVPGVKAQSVNWDFLRYVGDRFAERLGGQGVTHAVTAVTVPSP